MNVRIVVADERQASFFDASRLDGPMTERHRLQNPNAPLKDFDLESDRPGRRFAGKFGVRRGGSIPGAHHDVAGERSTERHDMLRFAKEIARHLDADRALNEFDRLVIVAPPKMLGMIRQSLSTHCQAMLAGEIPKDIVHTPHAISRLVPREVFYRF